MQLCIRKRRVRSIRRFFIVLCVISLVSVVVYSATVRPPSHYWRYGKVDPLVHDGYLTFRGNQPLRLHCNTCSLVFGSGHLLNSSKGEEIDSRECVIRSNIAPTTGFEKDVGRRTTVRCVTQKTYQVALTSLLYSSSCGLPLFDPEYTTNTIILKYGKQHFYDNMIALWFWPDLRLYIVQDHKFDEVFNYFKPINNDPIRMSSGFITINYARDFCDELHVYGIADETVCDKVKAEKQKDVPYHYYKDDETSETECNWYNYKLTQYYGHHFIQEKKMFSAWMKNSSLNIHFHAPEWT